MEHVIAILIIIVSYFAGVFTVLFHQRNIGHTCKEGVLVEQRKGTTTFRSTIGLPSYEAGVILSKYKCRVCGEFFYTARTITGEDVGYTQEYISYLFA